MATAYIPQGRLTQKVTRLMSYTFDLTSRCEFSFSICEGLLILRGFAVAHQGLVWSDHGIRPTSMKQLQSNSKKRCKWHVSKKKQSSILRFRFKSCQKYLSRIHLVINKVAGGNRESLFQKLGTSLKSLRCCETKLSSGVPRSHLNVFFCVLCNTFQQTGLTFSCCYRYIPFPQLFVDIIVLICLLKLAK